MQLGRSKYSSTHCFEMVTGNKLSGNFSIFDKAIETRIYSFDKFFLIDEKNPIFIQTENNEIVSLYDNICGHPSSISRQTEPSRTCHRLDVISNMAVIGHDAWAAEDGVKRVNFSIKHSYSVMRNQGKISRIFAEKYPGEDDLSILKVKANGLTASAGYGVVYEAGFGSPKEIHVEFSIEFDNPASLDDFLLPVCNYVRFLSFCLGAPLTPSVFHIDRMSLEEMNNAVEAQTYPGSHQVYYIWPELEIEPSEIWVGGSPAMAWSDVELGSLCTCLGEWLDRSPGWSKAYALMETCLRHKNEVSSTRLVNACRWFEEIPLTSAQQAISNDDINAIAEAAACAATERGLTTDIRRRVAGAVKRIKAETSEEQFRRLVKIVQGKFGVECLPDVAISHLKRAIIFRGRTAHGHYSPGNDSELLEFSASISALEALCFLLTAYDLPISRDGIGRVHYNPFIRDYRMAFAR